MQQDLTIVCPDKNTQAVLQAGLSRHQALGIRPITFRIIVHPERDGGVRTTGVDLLALETHQSRFGILIFDYEGCGENNLGVSQLESHLDNRLQQQWGTNAKAIVVDPEIDSWIWGSENTLQQVIGWTEQITIREWLVENGFVFHTNKPHRPKEAIESVLRKANLPRSSAIYGQIAGRISLARCVDPAFVNLRSQLKVWFS